jgi:hypothetical protein
MLGGIGIATTVEIAEQVGIEVDYKHPRIWGGWTVYSIVPDEIALGGRRPRRARDRHSIPVRRPRRVQIRDPRQRHPPDRAQARKRAPAPAGLLHRGRREKYGRGSRSSKGRIGLELHRGRFLQTVY